jgi:hypothetical protein
MLPHTEVINLGVHGYGHDQMLILLKKEGVKYEPDIVILGFMPIDMSRYLLKFRDFAKPRFILKGGKLKLTGSPQGSPSSPARDHPTGARVRSHEVSTIELPAEPAHVVARAEGASGGPARRTRW